MIEQETLLGYALNALPADELETVRTQLAGDTAARMNLERIQQVLQPLEADRGEVAPPYDLVSATLGKLDAALATPKPPRSFATRRWVELAVAASIGLLGFGLVATGINRYQDLNARIACQNNLQRMGMAMNTYADTHGNSFPEVGTASAPRAGDFPAVMQSVGAWPTDVAKTCDGVKPVGYAYSLGHRANGTHFGPARVKGLDSVMPLVGDFPMKDGKSVGLQSPHRLGSNVLFQDGHSIYTTVPTIGPNGDHIYQNTNGEVKAGTHAGDAVLGSPDDLP